MRQIEEIQFELKEIAGDARSMRARLIRLGDELQRNYITKDEARRQAAEGIAPTVPSYLLSCLDMLEDDDLKGVEQTLRQAAELTDSRLAEIWAERAKGADREPAP